MGTLLKVYWCLKNNARHKNSWVKKDIVEVYLESKRNCATKSLGIEQKASSRKGSYPLTGCAPDSAILWRTWSCELSSVSWLLEVQARYAFSTLPVFQIESNKMNIRVRGVFRGHSGLKSPNKLVSVIQAKAWKYTQYQWKIPKSKTPPEICFSLCPRSWLPCQLN